MFEFLVYDARKRARESLSLSIGLSLLAAMVIWVYPSFGEAFEDMDELLEAYPEGVIQLFDIRTMASLEGFLAFELYVFGWVILLGLYFAYSAASIVASDVEHGRADTLLAMPVSRTRLLVERFGALGLPILVVNLVVPVVVFVAARLIDEPFDAVDLLAVHLLSVPYLFACAGIGLVCSVVFSRAGVAQRVALAGTFALFLVESLFEGTDYEPVGSVTPMRYYDPNGILLDGAYELAGKAVLVGMVVVLVVVARAVFSRKDL